MVYVVESIEELYKKYKHTHIHIYISIHILTYTHTDLCSLYPCQNSKMIQLV